MSDRSTVNAAIRTNRPRASAGARPKAKEPRAPGRPLQDAAGPKTPNLMARTRLPLRRCGNLLALPIAADGRARVRRRSHSCVQCVSFDTSARWE